MAPLSFNWERRERKRSREAENKPFVQYRNSRIHQRRATTLEVFLKYDKDEDPERRFEVDELSTIFTEHFIEILKDESKWNKVPSDEMAWLDERDIEGNQRRPSGSMGILALYNALRREVL